MGMIRKFIKYIVSKAGYNILKVDNGNVNVTGMEEGLLRMKELGILPDLIVDIGAAKGNWTKKGLKFWPNSRYELVEPLVENEAYLEELKLSTKNMQVNPLVKHGWRFHQIWMEVEFMENILKIPDRFQ
jgi:hypothetical protein